jgi:hypothetical protein
LLTACAPTGLVSSWKASDAEPFAPGSRKVATVVMTKNEAVRRAAEDALARQITSRGGQDVPMYSILPGVAEPDEAQAKAALEKGGFDAVVVLRPVGSDKEISATFRTGAGTTDTGGARRGAAPTSGPTRSCPSRRSSTR